MDRIPMTPRGHAMITAELRRLKEEVRPKIVRDIEEARAHGDISENSEYEDAKERQALCEGKIRDFEGRLSASEVIDVTKLEPTDRVVFGATVVLEDVDTEEGVTYQIVGEIESDVKSGRISVVSPLARALIGKTVGDEVVLNAPGGVRNFTINDVRYV